jgi:hypothetical protein
MPNAPGTATPPSISPSCSITCCSSAPGGPDAAPAFLSACEALFRRYREGIDWEPAAALERRAARLLAGLLLARIDGKSPVEYLTLESQRDPVRQVARALLLRPPESIAQVQAALAAGLRLA